MVWTRLELYIHVLSCLRILVILLCSAISKRNHTYLNSLCIFLAVVTFFVPYIIHGVAQTQKYIWPGVESNLGNKGKGQGGKEKSMIISYIVYFY